MHLFPPLLDLSALAFPASDETGSATNPYVGYRRFFHAYWLARAGGIADDEYCSLVERLDTRVAQVAGRGFRPTPFARSDRLSARMGFAADGGIWVKDETANVSGSHKARHLFGLLVYLEVAERLGLGNLGRRPNLAIASCGNAALAAAIVAAAGRRALDVFVPVDAEAAVVRQLKELGARVTVCPREADARGDPTYQRLLRALADGALPFTTQGNQNGLAVEGGFTLGYEIATVVRNGPPLDRLVVQVGGGALASACIESLGEAAALGAVARVPRFHAVQTEGAWPLTRAFKRLTARISTNRGAGERATALRYAATHRSEFMWPWESEPRSIAHGILDDETYDWLAVVEGLLGSGGGSTVVSEDMLAQTNALAMETTGINVDPTGSAGLAGLVALRERAEIADHERVGVLFTGIRR